MPVTVSSGPKIDIDVITDADGINLVRNRAEQDISDVPSGIIGQAHSRTLQKKRTFIRNNP
jgi:hypothetical protein